MPIIIPISGKAESGKDFTAKLLKEELERQDQRVLIINYADQLKFICSKYFGWNGEKDNIGRSLLQQIGTEKVRSKNNNFWVDNVIEFVKVFQDDYDYVIIPDCRFANEIERWNNNFEFVSLRVERFNYENHLTPEQRLHSSETALDDYNFDYYIKSESGVDILKEKVIKFIERMNEWDNHLKEWNNV